MPKGTCRCGRRGELFGGDCLTCIQSAVGRGHGDYARTQQHMTAAERQSLPLTAFALRRRTPPGLPLRSPRPGSARGYILAASARLSMMRRLGHLGPGEYAEAARHIAEAARRVGIHSRLLER